MFCAKCGTEMLEDSTVCEVCGTKVKARIVDNTDPTTVETNSEEAVVEVNDNSVEKTEVVESEKNVVPHPYSLMDYEQDIEAQKQLKKARRLADAAFGTGLAAVAFLIFGIFFALLWVLVLILGIATFVLAFLSKRAMFELLEDELYDMQVRKIKVTSRNGKIAAVIAMISAVLIVAIIAVFLVYFAMFIATEFLQSDFTEAGLLLWDLIMSL